MIEKVYCVVEIVGQIVEQGRIVEPRVSVLYRDRLLLLLHLVLRHRLVLDRRLLLPQGGHVVYEKYMPIGNDLFRHMRSNGILLIVDVVLNLLEKLLFLV